jgi:hypothetical protein
MASSRRRRSIIRWTRGFAVLLIIHASLTTILAFTLLPPIGQVDGQDFSTPDYVLTREAGLVFAACLLVSGVALWQLRRWGLIVLATAVLLFSVPIGLFNLSFVDLKSLESIESVFFALGPVCVPYILLAVFIYGFWHGLGELE